MNEAIKNIRARNQRLGIVSDAEFVQLIREAYRHARARMLGADKDDNRGAAARWEEIECNLAGIYQRVETALHPSGWDEWARGNVALGQALNPVERSLIEAEEAERAAEEQRKQAVADEHVRRRDAAVQQVLAKFDMDDPDEAAIRALYVFNPWVMLRRGYIYEASGVGSRRGREALRRLIAKGALKQVWDSPAAEISIGIDYYNFEG
jgi:hypothetical protein